MDDPLEKGMATHSSILAREFHGQRSLGGAGRVGGYSPQGHKESDAAEETERICTWSLEQGRGEIQAGLQDHSVLCAR